MQKVLNSQRKLPQQGRSKALVDAVIEATVRILPTVGSLKVTTKKVADVAGVSIGSLYQYFPNKESLLTAVMEFAMKQEMKEFYEKIDGMKDKPLATVTDEMVDFALTSFLREREKIREIYRRAFELGQMPQLFAIRRETVQRLANEMHARAPHRQPDECYRISFIAVNSVMGVIMTMLYDETQTYRIDELAKELKTMLNNYFREA